MRILYGVTGEGLGHAMRSRVMAEHLRASGHDVKLVASARAHGYLKDSFPEVQPIPGFAMVYKDGEVSRSRTVRRLRHAVRPAVRETIELYRRAISGFQPDVCISDFDSFTHVFGKLFGRPVISLDHQHVIDRCEHADAIRARLPRDFRITKAIVRAKLPRCAHYVVTSFYFPRPKERCRLTTTLVGPILRPAVLQLAPATGDHVLVYQTAVTPVQLLTSLRAIPEQRFIVYARGGAGEQGNVSIRAFDEQRFLADLASARAVICNGGYTLMSEALFLGKPVLSLPLRHQGEQELNAAYLAALGLGVALPALDTAAIRRFVHAPPITPRIPAGNLRAFATIDRLLQEVT